MSGGSYNYTCFKVDEEYADKMYDEELNGFMKDLVVLLHDLEWWQSGDYSEETYRKKVKAFKEYWFGNPQTKVDAIEQIKNKAIKEIENL